MKKQLVLCGLAAATVCFAFASGDQLSFVKNDKIFLSIPVDSIDNLSYKGEQGAYTRVAITSVDGSTKSYPLDWFDHMVYTKEVLNGNVTTVAADGLDFTYQPTEEKVNSILDELEFQFARMVDAQVNLLGGYNGMPLEEHYYEMVYNMTVDNYTGYFTLCNSSFRYAPIETTYSCNPPYTEYPYGRLINMKNQLGNFLNREEANSVVELKAVALLMYNLVAQEVTDIYGVIPYVDHKTNKELYPFRFNTGVDIYQTIVNNLDSINTCLANFSKRPQWYQDKLNQQLQIYDQSTIRRDFDTWRRLANSLKLRMAIHIAKVAPDTARKWAEEAVVAGVIEAKDQQVGAFGGTALGSRVHCLQIIQNNWNDSRMGASFISLLASLKHPYMNYLFDTNSQDIINQSTGEVLPAGSEIVGLRAGIRMEGSQQYFSNMRVAYSTLNFNNDPKENARYMPFYILKWAEVDFLRAEGALRGWNMGGTAEFFYNRGIDNADCSDVFMVPTGDYHRYVAEYKELEKAVPYTYVDPMDDANYIESVTKIGVKWNDADDNETKLEKIITQKYIATFPYSYEAWVDLRRVGYPKIFPVLNPRYDNDGSLTDGEIIRRLPLPFNDSLAGKIDAETTGVEALGAPDLIATPVFWDVDTPNL